MHCSTRSLRAAAFAALAGMAQAWAPAAWAAQDTFEEVRELVQWVNASNDHKGRPFAIVDKKQARIHIFTSQGRLAGSSPALLGQTPGDHTVPGVGERAQRGEVRADERTTPAGRFDAQPGVNLQGEHVVWADYASAFAIHRVRPGRTHAARSASLQSNTPADNRMSLGCVIVPVAFYTQVVQRVLGARRTVVYVMPETRRMGDLFGSL